MFSKKKKKDKDLEQSSAQQLNQDLIVHNMPSLKELSGAFLSPGAPVSPSSGPVAKPKHKTAGLFIIISGLILIGGLAYGTYYFMIAPMLTQDKGPEASVVIAPTPPSPVEPPVEVAVPVDVPIVTPAAIDIASTTPATTTSDILNASGFKDSDNDGLNDEEETILGTSLSSADSDNDTYSDMSELLSGYNPTGAGKISNNPNLLKYSNADFKYETIQPKIWTVKSLSDGATVVFTAPDGSLIQASVQDNPEKASILSWYEESFPNVTVTYDKVRSTYSWEGIMGDTGLNFYLVGKDRDNIFVISYIPAAEGKIAYPNIFQMMINSFFLN